MADDGQDRLSEDTLFLACTRPAMIAGVPVEAMLVNFLITSIVYLLAGSMIYLVLGGVIHLLFRAIVRHDHNRFNVLFAYLHTKGRNRNKAVWGGSSYAPLPVMRRYSRKDVVGW
ncbi:type IV secretion system protein VirB3 [Aureimonas sp. N4]|uniref:type IV secretion system protein VirB3 n=1 Tax=Aureimonas sp. N4 TaxID=1638165 RepID=UPI00078270C9|nr:type IV secretion system protein VirB3 [Aureimonas sp. N4]